MIVADTNIIINLLLAGERTSEALAALEKDPVWAVPYLWRSEFCTVLTGYVRKKLLSWQEAQAILEHAQRLLRGKEYSVTPSHALELAVTSTCTTYDCEFVALAQDLGIKLVTMDKQILTQFPGATIALDKYARS
ncbi:MAG: type II toxin-antitoxin system VapC family toxin [Anaerolineales bacterium]